MKIVITPAKKMTNDASFLEVESLPVYLETTEKILNHLKTLTISEIKKMLGCSDRIAKEAYDNYQSMDLRNNLTCAILAYQGIQYDYMASHVMSYDDFAFLQQHLVILSGFYGILRPLDGVVSYRLEMNNPFKMAGYSSLYQVWGDKIYQELIKDDHEILDLGANQYARVIKKYLSKPVKYVKCYFKEEIDDQLKEIGVYVKMARGAMTRYIVKNRITTYEGVKLFNDLNYQYQEDLSSSEAFVFVRKSEKF